MSDRVWPPAGEGEVRVVSRAEEGIAAVMFAVVPRWSLCVVIDTAKPPYHVFWEYERLEPERSREQCSDPPPIIWSHGRLTAAGAGASRFFSVLKELGLTFGQIEAELRDLTGYKEPPS